MDCKRIGIALLALTFMVGCKPTVKGSGSIVARKMDFSGFDRVEAGNAFKLTLKRADAFSVEVRIDDNLVKYLKVAKQGDTLRIRMDGSKNYSVGDDSMQAVVSMPKLAGLDLSGASEASVSGFRSDEGLRIELSGASQLNGDVQAGGLDIDMSGASDLALKGSAKKAHIELSGASEADLSGLSLSRAKVDLSGASEATVNVSGRLDVDASGASTLSYLGRPEPGSVNTSGASSVKAIAQNSPN